MQKITGFGETKMETTVFVAGVIVVLILGAVYNHSAKKKNIHDFIAKQYGKKPKEREQDFDKIKLLWDELDDKEKCIDEITWNDLNMDDVFARINACYSSLGEQVLYRCIRRSPQSDENLEFLERQVNFFAENSRDRYEAQKALLRFGKRIGNYSIPMFMNHLDSFRLNGAWVYGCMLLLLAAAAVGAVFFRTIHAYSVLGLSFLVNLCIYSLMKNKYEIHLDSVAGINCMMEICLEFSGYDRSEMFGSLKSCRKVAKKIKKPAIFLNTRSQQTYTADFMEMCAIYLTGAFLLDFIFYNRIIGLLEKNRDCIMEILLAIGQVDMAISTASYRESLPVCCVPELCGDYVIDYREVYNPLLDDPVYNDFRLESNGMITGSNASGKSTFIKAIAINEILAFSIHTCTARRAVIPKLETYTSMAIRDDLLAGESYFVKEIKSLGRMIRCMEENRSALIVIDEILRGTNTKERVAASAAILNYLEKKNCIVIVASHDMELTRLLKDGAYRNYYFCEKNTEGLIEFDYKIHDGICTQTNAIKLLEYFGFPQEIIRNAKNILPVQPNPTAQVEIFWRK